MAVEEVRLFEKCIANWASKRIQEIVDAIDVNNGLVVL